MRTIAIVPPWHLAAAKPNLGHLVNGDRNAVDGQWRQLRAQLGGRGSMLGQCILKVLQNHALVLPHLQGAAEKPLKGRQGLFFCL